MMIEKEEDVEGFLYSTCCSFSVMTVIFASSFGCSDYVREIEVFFK